jgi:coenzyme PQQ precursor peptide PqqA
MKTPWIRPDFEELCVGGECTAYAGVAPASPARTAGEPHSQAVASSFVISHLSFVRPPVPRARAATAPGDK